MNPEIPTHNPEAEYADDPYAETKNKREQYKENLAADRKKMRQQDAMDNSAPLHPSTVKPDVLEPKAKTKQVLEKYYQNKFFQHLRETKGFDEYMNSSRQDKDRLFEEWKAKLK